MALVDLMRSRLLRANLCAIGCAVGAASFCSLSYGQDGFILQPKLNNKTAAAKPAPTEQAAKGLEPQVQLSIPSKVALHPEAIKKVATTPVGFGKSVSGSASSSNSNVDRQSLRWVTRGTGELHADTAPQFQTLPADIPTVGHASVPSQRPQNVTQSVTVPGIPTLHTQQPAALNTQHVPSRDELEIQRKQKLASVVSHQILRERNTSPKQVIKPIDNNPGWQSVGEQLTQRVQACEALLRRNAFYSAREEASKAMTSLVQVLDGMFNRYHCEPAWAAAQQALREAEDFAAEQRLSADQELLLRLINSHQTPVLKTADVTQLAPVTAAQHYRLYAQTCLEEAAQGHPWASEVLYNIGRTYQAQADAADGDAMAHRWRAITFYRAANRADPENVLALNQLGFVLLQLDRPQDARVALINAINLRPMPEALQNLIEASRRLGDAETRRWATSVLASTGGPPAAVQAPAVMELSPQAFMAISPRSAGAGNR